MKVKIGLDLSPNYELAYVASFREDLQKLADEDTETFIKDRRGKQSAAVNTGSQPTTPSEILMAAIDSDMPPSDPITAKAYRFDRAYQVKHRFALLNLYRVLVRNLKIDPGDIRKWIEKDTMLARLDSLQKKHATAPDTPTELAAALDWFLQHKYIFDEIGTDEERIAIDAALMAVPSTGSRLARLCEEAADWYNLIREDMDSRFKESTYIAYILTRPHLDNKIIMFYAYNNQGPPDQVNTVRLDGNGVMGIVRTGQTYADAVTSADEEYREVLAEKKSRGVEVAYGDQPKNLVGELLALKMGHAVSFHFLQ